MNEMQFSIEISAPKEKVWDVLWQDATIREWAGIIDPGTYMVGELTQGSEVAFISAENGYGVTSLVEKVTPNEYVLLRHSADTKESGTEERDKQWTGGAESYELIESYGVTTLKVAFDVPEELEEYFTTTYPKALKKIKELAEA
jgi:uncharacterized protein YndB with AHSA1/START domain